MEIERKIPWSNPDFGDKEREAIQRVVDSGWLTMGKETREYEKHVARVTKRRYNIAFNSGTSAITASLIALGVYNEGCSVKIPSYTFKATENACYAAGAQTIRYGDVDPMTGLMSPSTSGLRYEFQVPVHYAGLPIDPEQWAEVRYVVEDAAESFGSTTKRLIHGGGDRVACYSMHAAKLITMIEGGVASTDDEYTAYLLKAIRCHGENPEVKGEFITRGLNLKPLDICSAVGSVQLNKIGTYIDNRNRVAKTYYDELTGIVGFQRIPDYVDIHSYMMFPVYVDNPVKLSDGLKKHGVDTRLGWKPLYDKAGARYMYEHVICLPMFNLMTVEEAEYVSDCVKKCLRE